MSMRKRVWVSSCLECVVLNGINKTENDERIMVMTHHFAKLSGILCVNFTDKFSEDKSRLKYYYSILCG